MLTFATDFSKPLDKKMRGNQIWYHLVAFLVVAIWGSTFVFTKLLLLNGLTPAQIFTLRFIIGYVLLMAFALTRPSFRLLAQINKSPR